MHHHVSDARKAAEDSCASTHAQCTGLLPVPVAAVNIINPLQRINLIQLLPLSSFRKAPHGTEALSGMLLSLNNVTHVTH